MRHRIRVILTGVLLAASLNVSAAEPNRQSLIDAWVDYMPTAPGTVVFEARGGDRYYLEDENLPYAGELRLIGALVRPAEAMGEDATFTHIGMLEMELVDLPVERLQSQNYYYWLSDRQTLHFSAVGQAWLGPAAYRKAIQDLYSSDISFGPLSFMLNYGIWILLIILLIWVFVAFNKQHKKARALLDDSSSINALARENLDRSAAIQKESIQITRQVLEVQKENTRVLEQIRDRLGSGLSR